MATREESAQALENAIASSPALQQACRVAYARAQKCANHYLSRGRTAEVAEELAAEMASVVEEGVDSSPAKPLRACCAGCALCCHLRVEITPLEAIRIAGHVKASWPQAQIDELIDRLRNNIALIRTMTVEQHLATPVRCALLGSDNNCTVYDVRPLECRGYNSLSLADCQALFDAPASGATVRVDTQAKVSTRYAKRGMREALQRWGLDCRPYELNSIVLRALETKNVAERWIRGDDVFHGCASEHRDRQAHAAQARAKSANGGVGRNDPCPCGSGKKFKKCCMRTGSR